MTICLAPFRVLRNLSAAGHAWAYFNWILGLQENGCEVIWMEALPSGITGDDAVRSIRTLRRYMDALGVRAQIALLDCGATRVEPDSAHDELVRLTVPFESALEADLLLNFRYSLGSDVLDRFKRTALVDIDPGLLQVWIAQGNIAVARHTSYFTIGETVGQSGSLFPDCGLPWAYTPPPVSLQAWTPAAANDTAAYTTVSSWWGEWESFQGEAYNNEKRETFLPYADLPSLVPARLELALGVDDTDPDRVFLEERHWSVRRAREVCGTPESYRAYIQGSRGEFSCAKPSCLRFQNAWVSDRTLCYLAAGRPAIVQHTGPSRWLPDAAGLFRFRTPDEAAAAIGAVEADYVQQCGVARMLAETLFDARTVTAAVLDRALA